MCNVCPECVICACLNEIICTLLCKGKWSNTSRLLQCFPRVPTADGFYRLLDIWLSATLIEDSLLSIRLFEF